MEFVTKQARLILLYGMLLTRLFKYVMGEIPELFNESYVLYDRVMYPLTAQQERNTQKDYDIKRGRHSTSSSSAFGQPSSSHLNDDDDDDGNDEGTLRASTPSPTRFVNSLTNEGFTAALAVLVTEAPQSRQHESRKSPTAELFDVDSGRISIHHCEY
ncbi:hypothetical protein Tco_1084745 [Tanacetum coccineum]